jgi:hypothetical protein
MVERGGEATAVRGAAVLLAGASVLAVLKIFLGR